MEAKKRLAREIVTIYHSTDAAETAQAEFERVFSQREVPEDMPVYSIPDEAMDFDFKVTEPFGTDIVLAVATGVKTNDLYAFRKDRDQSFRSIEGGVRGIVVASREEIDGLSAA